MEDQRFDDLSRVAARSSRRQAFKALGGGAAGGLLAMLGIRRDAVEAQVDDVECCPPDHPKLCGYACTDFMSDASNCGACGAACKRNQSCYQGICSASVRCSKRQTDCGGTCVDLSTDVNNCGACGNVCAAGASCVSGACQCPSGTTPCGGACVDLSTDVNNCGACGTTCQFPNAIARCLNSYCQILQCNSGWGDCDSLRSNGCETNLNTDSNNCGFCGRVCGSGTTCQNGECAA